MTVTEWDIHHALELQWIQKPLDFQGSKLHLLACEVMPDGWRINDPAGYWASPSIDFLLLGEDGTLWIGELKNQRDTLRDAWNAFCQITYIEYLFRQHYFSADTIPTIFTNYTQNLVKRGITSERTKEGLPKFSGQIKCMLIANSMKHWCAVAAMVSALSFGDIKEYLLRTYSAQSQANSAIKRFCSMGLTDNTKFSVPSLFLLAESGLAEVHC